MNELASYIAALFSDGTFVSILAIVISVLSISLSIVSAVLMKKISERDTARIAREIAQL